MLDDSHDDAAAFGINPELFDGEEVLDQFEVWEENWDIVMMFLRLQTQWNVTMGGYVGLQYESLQWLCGLYLVKDTRVMLEGIQVMEAAALKRLNDYE